MTPLTEDCGLVEWVNDLSTLRHTVQSMLIAEGLYHKSTNATIKKMYDGYPQVTSHSPPPKHCVGWDSGFR